MKFFIFLLIIAVFLQSSFIGVNLALVLLISKNLASPEKQDLLAAFLAGVLVGLLQAQNIGFWALLFILIVKLTSLTKKLPFSKNILTILIVSSTAILLTDLLEMAYFQKTFESLKVIWEVLLSLPFYLFLLFWEERIMVKPDARLKLRS